MILPFLEPGEIQRNCAEAELDADAAHMFVAFATRVSADPVLTKHAGAAHTCLFDTTDECEAVIAQAEAAFGEEASLLRGLMVLDSVRRILARQSARGVPADITRASLESQSFPTLRDYVARHGRVGADAGIWSWYRTVGSGDLYRLGRLEFIPERWDYDFRVFVNDATGDTIAVLNPGQNFTSAGYMVGSTVWTSTLHESEDATVGYAISPRGFAISKPVRLPRAEWRLALGPDAIVLDMHIPGDIPLTLAAIRDAMEQADLFFDRFYQGQPFAAFVSDSWLFSTQIEDMLPPESNILRWQREGYLYPGGPGENDFLANIFGSSTIDLATAPRDTRLRRAVISYIERGGQLRYGGYFLLRKDLGRFGSQPYRITSEQAIARLLVD